MEAPKLLCTKCKEEKSQYFFYYIGIDKRPNRNGYDYNCKTCKNSYRREWREKNPGKDNDAARRSEYKRWYGITLEEYDQMFARQEGKCLICKLDWEQMPQPKNAKFIERRRFDIDHDHATGKIRGLLCHSCNKGLGNFRDSIENMRNAVKYLEEHNG